jgi:Fe-S cluster assembly ATP-binding protein
MEVDIDEGEGGVAEFQEIMSEKMEQLDMDATFAQTI